MQPKFSHIKNLSPGFIEVRGKIKQIKTIVSPMTKSQCIGYSYSIMRFDSSRKISKSSIDRGNQNLKNTIEI